MWFVHSNHWPWAPANVNRIQTLCLIVISLCVLLFYFFDQHLLLFLPLIPIAFLLHLTHIGKKINEIQENFAEEDGLFQSGLIILNNKNSPGVIVLQKDALLLIPVTGYPQAIAHQDIPAKLDYIQDFRQNQAKIAMTVHDQQISLILDSSFADQFINQKKRGPS